MRGYRLKQVEQYILEHDTVSLEELVKTFGVSLNTVRRDIAELIKLGTVEKIYGGVRTSRKPTLLPFEERHHSHMDLKERIGRAAAGLVRDGDIVYVDSGTTTIKLLPELTERRNVTVITGSLPAIAEAAQYGNINLIATAGQLDRKTNSFIGADTVKSLAHFNIQKAFMAATGLSLASGATNSSLLEYEIKAHVVRHCREAYLLIDSSKFGVSALATYAALEDFDEIVTDAPPPAEYAERCAELGVGIVLGD